MTHTTKIDITRGESVVVDTGTGEVLYYLVPFDPSRYEPSRGYRKSIDEVSITMPGELGEWVMEGGYRLTQNIEDIVVDKEITDKEMRVLMYVGSTVEGQNIVFITVKKIMDKLGIDKTQVSKVLRSLEAKGYITLEHRNTFGVGSRVLAVSPRYFWKGNYGVRNTYLGIWCKPSTEKIHEILYSCPL